MTNWVLALSGTVIPCWTIQPLTPGELLVTNIAEVEKQTELTTVICLKLGNSLTLPTMSKFTTVKDEFELDLYEDNEFIPMAIPMAEIIDAIKKISRHSITCQWIY